MRRQTLLLTLCYACCLPAFASAGGLDLEVVRTPINSYRLFAMSMDDDGFIWAGSIHRVIHRYDPRTGGVETLRLPYDANASACICVGTRVYVLGQSYPRLMIYDRQTKQFREAAYPSAKPDVWYGTSPVDGRWMYLFDRGSAGVIKWDTQTDTGVALKWPYDQPLPGSGQYRADDSGLWCPVWDYAGLQYVPLGLARLDVATDQFTGFWPFPKPGEQGLKPYDRPESTLFMPHTLKGRLVPFDYAAKHWCEPIEVPRFGELFGFIGASVEFGGRHYFSLSTYDGDDLGCDGKPYHFLNGLLEFDPRTKGFEFPTLEAKDAYYQVAYALSAGGHFFATGSDILTPDETLDGTGSGEVVFWQSRGVRQETN